MLKDSSLNPFVAQFIDFNANHELREIGKNICANLQ